MPLIKLSLTASLDDSRKSELMSRLSKIVAEGTGKPEQYVMVALEQAPMFMSGKEGDAAFADIRGIGLSGSAAGRLSKEICELIYSIAGVPPARIYLNFTSIPAANWGWDGATFG